jgi:hypothetical protein
MAKAPRKCPIHVEDLSSEDSCSSEPSFDTQYSPNSWIKALNACYDEETQIKICREHARYLNALICAREKVKNNSQNNFAGSMDCSE